jgi:hypothetical protein
MGSWNHVTWTQASQVAELMDLDLSFLQDPEADPETAYRSLRDRGDVAVALRYLALALPRLEAVAWAARTLRDWVGKDPPRVAERQALDSVLRWLEEPSDEYRRAAHEAGRRAPRNSAGQVLSDAVFMSGGSISEPDLPPVQPPLHACGSFAAAALLAGAYETSNPAEALVAACDAGDKVAALGLKALGPQ